MPKELSKAEIKAKARKIQQIYNSYLVKLKELKVEQARIIDDFIKELEQRKITDIKKTLE
ncbi:hypothetical protein KJ903_03510 [Patescibacteria group bacterium]|nr:hypothetical protein [Patescibacteria group bacterium]